MNRYTLLATALAAAVVCVAGWGLAAAVPQIKVGDKIVVLHDTHVQAESERLAPLKSGTELVAEQLSGDWVAVTVDRKGKKVSGWVYRPDVTADPKTAFAALVVRRVIGKPENDFERIDKNRDGGLTLDEFVAGTRKETLADLNGKLERTLDAQKRQLGATGVPQTEFAQRMALLFALSGGADGTTFRGWKRNPTNEETEQVIGDFLQTHDLRRSRVAQDLADPEDPQRRTQRATAMFKWADKNHDGKLTLEEFKQAPPQERQRND